MNLKAIIIIILVIAVAVVIYAGVSLTKPATTSDKNVNTNVVSPVTSNNPPVTENNTPASGNITKPSGTTSTVNLSGIDSLINSGISSEESVLSEENSSTSNVTGDSTQIGALGQTLVQ